MKTFLLSFTVTLVALFASAAFVMLLFGAWHSHTPAVPALGLVDGMYLVTLTAFLGATTAGTARS